MPVTFVTDPPDAEGLALDASVEDELTATWDDTTNYGDYRIQAREAGEGDAWGAVDEATVGEATTSYTITGLEDGEEYDVQLRTETEHVTGDWLALAEVTKLPAPTGLDSPAQGTTSVDLSWTDTTDNEDGFRIRREERINGSWDDAVEVADVAPDTTSHTDDTPQPGTTYRYTVRVYTEHVFADSGTTEATTDGLGNPRRNLPASGWHVRVERSDGTVRTVSTGSPSFLPSLNAAPTAEIPVPRDETWQSQNWERADVEVWKDGQRLPIEELVTPGVEPGRTVLEARGGADLQDDVEAEFENTAAHDAFTQLVDEHTDYETNVDDPASETIEGRELQSASTTSEFQTQILTEIDDSTPLEIVDDEIHTLQTAFTREAEVSADTNVTPFNGDQFSNAQALPFGALGEYATWGFEPDYDIPAGEFTVFVRVQATGSSTPDIRWTLDGDEIATYAPGTLGEFRHRDLSTVGNWSDPGLVETGTSHTLRAEVQEAGEDTFYVDTVAPADGRWDYDLDNDISNGERISGPQLHPIIDVEWVDVVTAYNVVGAQVASTWDDVSDGQAMAVSNDQGATFPLSVSNSASLDQDFTNDGGTLRLRTTIGRWGSDPNQTPTEGYQSQSLESYTLSADLENTPVLVSKSYAGPLEETLTEIADYAGSAWEAQWDSAADTIRLEYTRPGQRTADSDIEIADYRVDTDFDVWERIVVEGGRNTVTDERWTADVGTAVPLAHTGLIDGAASVNDPETGEVFDRGEDYQVSGQAGEITALSSGDLSDGAEYAISYEFKPVGSHTVADAADPPRTRRVSIAAIATERGCDQAALQLAQELSEPVVTAEVTLPKSPAGISLVDDLALDALPTNGERMQIWDLEDTPEETTLQLGSRDQIEDVIRTLSNRLSAASRRV